MKYYIILICLLARLNCFGQIAEIKFEDFIIKIENLKLFQQDRLLDRTYLADAEFSLEIGESVEGKIIKLENSSLTEITIEQAYETSITIMNEGPHCNLINWKHYKSDWTKLPFINEHGFISASYNESERSKFPKTTKEELIQAVKKACPGWDAVAQKVKTVGEYPSEVGICAYLIRVIGTDNLGKRVQRTLTFKVPMGC